MIVQSGQPEVISLIVGRHPHIMETAGGVGESGGGWEIEHVREIQLITANTRTNPRVHGVVEDMVRKGVRIRDLFE